MNLDPSYKTEIVQTFHIFDERRTGNITPYALKLLLRTLGHRVTKQEVWKEINKSSQRLGLSFSNRDQDDERNDVDINIEMTLDIIQESYNQFFDQALYLKNSFRLFDEGNKGYIDKSDLKRVIEEIRNECKTIGLDAKHESNLLSSLRDDRLQAMIEEFDDDMDSAINQKEFEKIMDINR